MENIQTITKHRDIAEIRVKYTQTNWSQLVEDIQNAPESWELFIDAVALDVGKAVNNISNLFEGNTESQLEEKIWDSVQDLRALGYDDSEIRIAIKEALDALKNPDGYKSMQGCVAEAPSMWNPLNWLVNTAHACPPFKSEAARMIFQNCSADDAVLSYKQKYVQYQIAQAAAGERPDLLNFANPEMLKVVLSLNGQDIPKEDLDALYKYRYDQLIYDIAEKYYVTGEINAAQYLAEGYYTQLSEPDEYEDYSHIFNQYLLGPMLALLTPGKGMKKGRGKAADGGAISNEKPSIWTKGPQPSNARNAYKHWKNHGKQFPELQNSLQYQKATEKFLQKPPSGTLTKVRDNGDVVRYHQKTNIFAVMDKKGTPKTMFKPTRGRGYFDDEAGKLYD